MTSSLLFICGKKHRSLEMASVCMQKSLFVAHNLGKKVWLTAWNRRAGSVSPVADSGPGEAEIPQSHCERNKLASGEVQETCLLQLKSQPLLLSM